VKNRDFGGAEIWAKKGTLFEKNPKNGRFHTEESTRKPLIEGIRLGFGPKIGFFRVFSGFSGFSGKNVGGEPRFSPIGTENHQNRPFSKPTGLRTPRIPRTPITTTTTPPHGGGVGWWWDYI